MTKKKASVTNGAPCSFDPDYIKTLVSQAVYLDCSVSQEYIALAHPATVSGLNRMRDEFLKKYSSPMVSSDVLETLAFEKFRKVNDRMEKVNAFCRFPNPTIHISRQSRTIDKILVRARALMRHVLTDFTEEEWFLACKNSQGTTIGVTYADTSAESKFSFPLTCTPRVKSLFERYLLLFPEEKEQILALNRPRYGSSLNEMIYNVVEGSKSTTVEKNDEARRFIAVEPTLNMFFQQGLMTMMYDRMLVVGLDVSSLPSKHQLLALLSSISHENATIDWRSASDCVSIKLLEWQLPGKWFVAIDRVRSPNTSIRGEQVPLHMISSMGNAVTFPLETLVFWTIAHGTILTLDGSCSLTPEWCDYKRVSVFGDDCIVPDYYAADFISACEYVGFEVNLDKTHLGPDSFRESCGGDYLSGYSTRPFNLRAPHSSKLSSLEPWLYIMMNSLLEKYRSYFGDLNYVYRASAFMSVMSELFAMYGLKLKVVPSHYPEDSGLCLNFDIDRLLTNYEFELDPVYRDQHGTYMFKFLRFNYQSVGYIHGGIRWSALKHTMERQRVLNLANDGSTPWYSYLPKKEDGRATDAWLYKTRRIGGYVVGKGLDSAWDQGPQSQCKEVNSHKRKKIYVTDAGKDPVKGRRPKRIVRNLSPN